MADPQDPFQSGDKDGSVGTEASSLDLADQSDDDSPPSDGEHCELEVPSGGFQWLFDGAVVSEMRAKFWGVVKSSLGKMRNGYVDVTRLTLPMELLDHMGLHERLCSWWSYMEILDNAAAMTNPVERLKEVTAFAISGIHRSIPGKRPLFPIQGETFSMAYDNGAMAYLEEISSFPQVSAYHVIGPHNQWELFGTFSIKMLVHQNCLKILHTGEHNVRFEDGTSICWRIPPIYIRGVFFGEVAAEVHGKIRVRNKVAGLTAHIQFDPERAGNVTSFLQTQKKPSETLDGHIENAAGSILSSICGEWTSHVIFEGFTHWDRYENKIAACLDRSDPETTLVAPSDTSLRSDLVALLNGDYESAEEELLKIQERERRQRKLRQDYKESRITRRPVL